MHRWFKRVRPTLQLEVADCGVACLAMILEYHGRHCAIDQLRIASGGARDGSSALQLVHAARSNGLSARGFRCDVHGLRRVGAPAILHWEGNHYVVLERIDRRFARIVDPSVGARRLSLDEVARSFSGVVIAFTPLTGGNRHTRSNGIFSRYGRRLAEVKGVLAFVLLAALLQELLAVAMPATTRVLMDHVVIAKRQGWLLPAGLGVFGVSLARTAARWLRTRALDGLAMRLSWSFTRELGGHLLSLPLPFFGTRRRGDLLDRVNGQGRLREALLSTVSVSLDLLLVASLLGLVLWYDFRLGAVVFAAAVARVGYLSIAGRALSFKASEELLERGREASKALDLSMSLELAQSFRAEKRYVARYLASVRARAASSFDVESIRSGMQQACVAFDTLTYVGLLWFGGSAVIDGRITVGVLASFLSVHAMLSAPLQSVVAASVALAEARGLVERSEDVWATIPANSAPVTQNALPVIRGVSANDVGFRFAAQSPWILNGINLRVSPGEHVAITGPSGSGKSCLLRLLCGLVEPNAGRITIDGSDVRCLGAGSRGTRVVGLVDEPILRRASVATNLRLVAPQASLEDLKRACFVACFDEVLAVLPRGLFEIIEEDGLNLSGGERQRLALAQAVVCRPDVLVLDEATSCLDADLERRVFSRLRSLGCSVIFVSHRSSAISMADRQCDMATLAAPDILDAAG